MDDTHIFFGKAGQEWPLDEEGLARLEQAVEEHIAAGSPSLSIVGNRDDPAYRLLTMSASMAPSLVREIRRLRDLTKGVGCPECGGYLDRVEMESGIIDKCSKDETHNWRVPGMTDQTLRSIERLCSGVDVGGSGSDLQVEISAAMDDVPRLTEEVRRLRKENERLRSVVPR